MVLFFRVSGIVCVLPIAMLIGCGDMAPQKTEASTKSEFPVQQSSPQHQYAVFNSDGKSFLVDTVAGSVWVYSAKSSVFESVKIAGNEEKIRTYNPKTGKLEPPIVVTPEDMKQ